MRASGENPDSGSGPRDPRTPRRDEPPRPRGRAVTTKVLVGLLGAVILLMAAVVSLLLSRPAQQAHVAIEKVLAPEAPRGVTATEVVLGMASPFSGANRELGRAMKAGVEAALAEVNAAGGVHGRTLRLVTVDDGYEPSRTAPAMKQLLDVDRVFAVVGNVGTPTAAVAIPYCAERKVVFMGALSGSELLRRSPPDRYVFNFRPSYAEETAAAVRYLVGVRRLAPGRIAVFAQEDAFGDSGWNGVAAELARRGVDPKRLVRVGYKRNTADVAEAVGTVKRRAEELDAVVMVATYKAAAAFIRNLRESGLKLLTTNVSPVDANALAEDLVGEGPRYTEGVVVTQTVPLPTSRVAGAVRFQHAMERFGGRERRGFVAFEGWVVGHLLAEGLRRAGKDVDSEKLVAGLEQVRDLDLGIGTRMSFGAGEHQASHRVWGTALQPDGTWKQIDLE